MGHLSERWTTLHCHSVWPVGFKSRFIPIYEGRAVPLNLEGFVIIPNPLYLMNPPAREIWEISDGSQTWHHLHHHHRWLLAFWHAIFSTCFCHSVCVHSVCVCVLYNLRIAQVTGGSTVGVVMSASCTLSQGQFGLPMPLTPPKQAVSANPPPSPSNPRQSWANPKLIQGHSQLGVSHRAMPGHHRHNEQLRYDMILQQSSIRRLCKGGKNAIWNFQSWRAKALLKCV